MTSKVICFDSFLQYESWIKRHPQYSRHSVFSLSQPLVDVTENHRREFLSAYVDCVGELSVHNQNLLWWACDISSKNRFFSPLAQPLEKLFKLIHLTKKSNEDVLIIVDVPYLFSQQVPCEWHGRKPLLVLDILNEWAMRFGRIIKHIIYIIPRIIKARRLFGDVINEQSKDKTAVYLIKTFISSRSFDSVGQYKDTFFGSLPDFLSQHRRVILLADVIDDFSKTFKLMKEFGQGRIYPLEAFMTMTDVFKASWQMAFCKIRIPHQLDFCSHNVSDSVRQICKRNGSKIQPLQLYQYRMMKQLLEKFAVHEFLFTCEFNPWEKMCLSALREKTPVIKALGYQHTVVPQASANMFVSRLEEKIMPRPDLILTVGDKPRDIIAHYETCKPSKLKASCGLRFEYLSKQTLSPRQKRGNVLLALEGLPQVVGMTNYVLKQWPSCKSYQLRIRTHPVLPIDKFKGQLTCDPSHMPQVEISKTTSLQEDLSWADIVIYWGSTVALESLSMGKPVIHYDNGSLLSFDPLFELNDFRWIISEQSSLAGILDEISVLPDKIYERKTSKSYRVYSLLFSSSHRGSHEIVPLTF